MTKTVKVQLIGTSEPLEHQAKNTYQWGAFFVVYTPDNKVFKYPIANIWRVVEDYGTHLSGN